MDWAKLIVQHFKIYPYFLFVHDFIHLRLMLGQVEL